MKAATSGPRGVDRGLPAEGFFFLPAPEREALEQAALEDDELFAQLEEAEDALLEAWAHDQLAGERRERCAALLAASPRLQERVAVIRLLDRRARERSVPRRRPGTWLALAAGLALTAGAGGWIALRQQATPAGTAVDIAGPGDAASPTLFLPLTSPRGSAAAVLPVASDQLALRVEVGAEPAESFRVRLSDSLGGELAVFDGLAAVTWQGTRVVEVRVPRLPAQARVLLTVEALATGGSATPIAYHELALPPGP